MPSHHPARWLVAGVLGVCVLAYSAVYVCLGYFMEDTGP